MKVCSSLAVAALVVFVAGSAWADGIGGGARAGNPGGGVRDLPGRGGSTGQDLLGERRDRTRRLDELSPPASSSPPSTRAPAAQPQPQPRGATNGPSLVHLHHGSVQMVAGLARVDLTLEVQNVGRQPMEWRRVYAVDPVAEVIGAVLHRANEAPIVARTLTTQDAQRIYTEIRTPPPTRTRPRRPPRSRDPLLLQRPSADRLHVSIWPIAPAETIRVELTFVTPLRGRGARRTYVDVMGGPSRTDRPPRLTRPGEEQPRRARHPVSAKADWLMNPGELVLSSAPPLGMDFRGEAGGYLQFAGEAATDAGSPRPSVSFLTANRDQGALLAGRGSFLGRIAVWRFDPQAFLAERGYELREDIDLRLVPLKGNTSRLAPNLFNRLDEPLPVTALLVGGASSTVRYRVDVLDSQGHVIESVLQSQRIKEEKLDGALEEAISGWHRAALVHRVSEWAAGDSARQLRAQRFAVDMGVLVAGSSALAVPQSERRRMSQRSRRLYDSDGVPLGAPRHEADMKSPPRGALND